MDLAEEAAVEEEVAVEGKEPVLVERETMIDTT